MFETIETEEKYNNVKGTKTSWTIMVNEMSTFT